MLSTFLPPTTYIVQDGGYFYFFADKDAANFEDGDVLLYVESPFDPELGDIKTAEKARNWLINTYPQTFMTF
jgi:hypothetical protein